MVISPPTQTSVHKYIQKFNSLPSQSDFPHFSTQSRKCEFTSCKVFSSNLVCLPLFFGFVFVCFSCNLVCLRECLMQSKIFFAEQISSYNNFFTLLSTKTHRVYIELSGRVGYSIKERVFQEIFGEWLKGFDEYYLYQSCRGRE